MAADPICLCGDPQGVHKMRKGGCRAADCGCDRFEVDEKATAEAEANDAQWQADVDELARTQNERAELAAADDRGWGPLAPDLAHAEELRAEPARPTPHLDRVKTDLARVEKERAELEGIAGRKYDEIQALQAELARLREDMRIQARVVVERNAELEQLRVHLIEARAATGWVVARDTGEGCERCEQPIQRGEAYVPPLPGVGLYEHVHCPDVAPAVPAGAVLYAYDAWSCLVDGGCGARYTVPDPQHPCGRPMPTRVTITHRTEGAPPACQP